MHRFYPSIHQAICYDLFCPYRYYYLRMAGKMLYANTITGIVKDSISQPVDVATVSLMRLTGFRFCQGRVYQTSMVRLNL